VDDPWSVAVRVDSLIFSMNISAHLNLAGLCEPQRLHAGLVSVSSISADCRADVQVQRCA
jgi:hypothetical protein